MNEIILHGDMRERYGEMFRADVQNPIDAFRALRAQLDGFENMIREGSWHVIREMPNGTFAINEDMLMLGMNNCKLHFIPAVEGDGQKGLGKAILGVALIGAAFIPGAQVFLAGAMPLIGGTIKTFAILSGLALALGGLSLMLAPTPKLHTGSGDNDQSFLIGGNFNPSGQNYAVPLVYGDWRVKGMPVATEIVTNEVSVPNGTVYNNPYGGIGGGGLPGEFSLQVRV